MRSSINGILFLILSAAVIVAVSGCTITSQGTNTTAQDELQNVTMDDIDEMLAEGPVFLEFSADWCPYCQDEKLIVQNLTEEYEDVTFALIDADHNYDLDREFMVDGIPQMDVIIKKNVDGSYLYVGPDGKTTTNRAASRIIGFTGQQDLKKALDAAVEARKDG